MIIGISRLTTYVYPRHQSLSIQYLTSWHYQDLLNGEQYTGESATSIFDYAEFSEAVHVLAVTMRVTGVDYEHDSRNPTTGELYNDQWPERPKLLLKGETSYQGQHMSNMNGSVHMTPDGEVRWDIVSTLVC